MGSVAYFVFICGLWRESTCLMVIGCLVCVVCILCVHPFCNVQVYSVFQCLHLPPHQNPFQHCTSHPLSQTPLTPHPTHPASVASWLAAMEWIVEDRGKNIYNKGISLIILVWSPTRHFISIRLFSSPSHSNPPSYTSCVFTGIWLIHLTLILWYFGSPQPVLYVWCRCVSKRELKTFEYDVIIGSQFFSRCFLALWSSGLSAWQLAAFGAPPLLWGRFLLPECLWKHCLAHLCFIQQGTHLFHCGFNRR